MLGMSVGRNFVNLSLIVLSIPKKFGSMLMVIKFLHARIYYCIRFIHWAVGNDIESSPYGTSEVPIIPENPTNTPFLNIAIKIK